MYNPGLSHPSKRINVEHYHKPTYSEIATFSFANEPTIFHARRKMTVGDHQGANYSDTNAGGRVIQSDSCPGFYQDMKDALFHAGRAIMTAVGAYDAMSGKTEVTEHNNKANKQQLQDNLEGDERRTSSLVQRPPSKKPKAIENSAIFVKDTPKKQTHSIVDLGERLNNSITPEKQGKAEFCTMKDPFKWHQQGSEGPVSSNKRVPYGSSFIRKKSSRGKTSMDNIQLTSKSPMEEIRYLRMVYNGQYKAPSLIESHKEEQMLLREHELKQYRMSSSTQWNTLTERIKAIMQKSLNKQDFDNDLILLKERKINPSELGQQRLLGREFRFDTSILTFKEEFESYKRLKEERDRVQLEVRERRERLKVLVPQLTKDDLQKVKNTQNRSDNGVVMNKHNIELKVHDFKTLAPRRWLNDIIIEFFMKHVELTTPQLVAFNSYFYTSLSRNGYQGVRRWMKKKKAEIDNLHKVFVPINLNQSHWALGVIDISNSKIYYVDSLSSGPESMSFAILKDLQSYLMQESKGTLGEDFELVHADCPQQPNGFDCGVYVCTNALYLSKDAPLTFDCKDVERMRPYIGHLILSSD
ncbi:LADA_0A06722g1_1 [Lachancea dasiensis]|uniref:LADA_0A06722g1_1 n=1 Tax=Lachancea dasiensis TaxID=1072105 RepID=A0A1G4IPP0_9SACH|nr:LADA_0A06722g1_1 [Lachancea dasiensis]